MKKFLFPIAALFVLLAASCEKEVRDNSALYNANQAYLTRGNWKIVAVTDESGGLDLWSIQPACIKDNTFKFNTNYSITVDVGADKCVANEPQTSTGGSWSLLNNMTQLQVTETQGNNTVTTLSTIQKLTLDSLKLSTTREVSPGVNSTSVTTYVHVQ